ncbi:hypothetical protein Taro_031499 [Colocasia esculenta]|uniref:Uncharacterized protein n=1 Tax=Colocasia esculenta TaxID=4460 RepID=A0A843VIY9_COLES|nr:hypothetical protein [Colocasia esculenta]
MLEHVFAVVIAEPGVGGVGVREKDAGEGGGGLSSIRVDVDPEGPHHLLHVRPQELPVVSQSIVVLFECTASFGEADKDAMLEMGDATAT